MIDLSKDTQQIYTVRDESLAKLAANFQKEQQALIDGEGNLRADHDKQLQALAAKLDKELQEFIAGQEAAFENLQAESLAKEQAIIAKAESDVDELAGKYQAELLAENEKAQKDAAAAAEKLSAVDRDAIRNKYGVKELKKLAKTAGLRGYSRLGEGELIDLLLVNGVEL